MVSWRWGLKEMRFTEMLGYLLRTAEPPPVPGGLPGRETAREMRIYCLSR